MNHKTRLEYIRILLRTRNEYLYSTADPKGCFSRFGSLPGEAPGSEVPCETCHKRGKVKRTRGGWESFSYCPTCNGSGWRKATRKEQVYDSYTREKVTHSESKNPPSMTSKQLDRALESLRNDAASRAGITRNRDKIESLREKRDISGSYQELEQALDILRQNYPSLSYVLETKDAIQSPTMPLLESLAVNLLSQYMPKKIFIPSWEYRKLKERRRKSIIRLAKMQIPTVKIASLLGVSKKSVSRVLAVKAAK